jgi:hypothetical protein
MIVTTATGTITVFNLTWWALRTRGLRSLRRSSRGRSSEAEPGSAV